MGKRPTTDALVICQECQVRFPPKQFYQRYCTKKCRLKAYWRRQFAKEQA